MLLYSMFYSTSCLDTELSQSHHRNTSVVLNIPPYKCRHFSCTAGCVLQSRSLAASPSSPSQQSLPAVPPASPSSESLWAPASVKVSFRVATTADRLKPACYRAAALLTAGGGRGPGFSSGRKSPSWRVEEMITDIPHTFFHRCPISLSPLLTPQTSNLLFFFFLNPENVCNPAWIVFVDCVDCCVCWLTLAEEICQSPVINIGLMVLDWSSSKV